MSTIQEQIEELQRIQAEADAFLNERINAEEAARKRKEEAEAKLQKLELEQAEERLEQHKEGIKPLLEVNNKAVADLQAAIKSRDIAKAIKAAEAAQLSYNRIVSYNVNAEDIIEPLIDHRYQEAVTRLVAAGLDELHAQNEATRETEGAHFGLMMSLPFGVSAVNAAIETLSHVTGDELRILTGVIYAIFGQLYQAPENFDARKATANSIRHQLRG